MRTGVRIEETVQVKAALAKGTETVEEIAQRFNVPVDVIESFVETKPEPKKDEQKQAE